MRTNIKTVLASAAVVVSLAGGSTVALASMSGGFAPGSTGASGPFGSAFRPRTSQACTVPSPPGTVVNVTETDIGAAMGGFGPMMGGSGYSGGYGRGYGMMRGAMRLQASPTTLRAGTVSIAVANDGSMTHELVVLPLADGAQAGARPMGSDGKVSENASLGEASASCGAGAGDGITAGSAGWVTVTMKPGRYELVCNIRGHYAAGMYAELDVTT